MFVILSRLSEFPREQPTVIGPFVTREKAQHYIDYEAWDLITSIVPIQPPLTDED